MCNILKATYENFLFSCFTRKPHGLSVLREIKKADENAKVFLLTASGNLKSINESIQACAVTYIFKPFKMEDLSHAIKLILK